MADTDLIKLYSKRILELASEMPHADRLQNPDATVKKRSSLCGSAVTVDVKVADGKVVEYGQDVKACALGQASAAILGDVVIGQSLEAISQARDELEAMLASDGPVPHAPFDGYEVLLPARDFRNRHASILLALNATVDAIKVAQQEDCA